MWLLTVNVTYRVSPRGVPWGQALSQFLCTLSKCIHCFRSEQSRAPSMSNYLHQIILYLFCGLSASASVCTLHQISLSVIPRYPSQFIEVTGLVLPPTVDQGCNVGGSVSTLNSVLKCFSWFRSVKKTVNLVSKGWQDNCLVGSLPHYV